MRPFATRNRDAGHVNARRAHIFNVRNKPQDNKHTPLTRHNRTKLPRESEDTTRQAVITKKEDENQRKMVRTNQVRDTKKKTGKIHDKIRAMSRKISGKEYTLSEKLSPKNVQANTRPKLSCKTAGASKKDKTTTFTMEDGTTVERPKDPLRISDASIKRLATGARISRFSKDAYEPVRKLVHDTVSVHARLCKIFAMYDLRKRILPRDVIKAMKVMSTDETSVYM